MTFRRLMGELADWLTESARSRREPHIYVRGCEPLADAIKKLGGNCENHTTRNSAKRAAELNSSHNTQETWSVRIEGIRITATKDRPATAAECAAVREETIQ